MCTSAGARTLVLRPTHPEYLGVVLLRFFFEIHHQQWLTYALPRCESPTHAWTCARPPETVGGLTWPAAGGVGMRTGKGTVPIEKEARKPFAWPSMSVTRRIIRILILLLSHMHPTHTCALSAAREHAALTLKILVLLFGPRAVRQQIKRVMHQTVNLQNVVL